MRSRSAANARRLSPSSISILILAVLPLLRSASGLVAICFEIARDHETAWLPSRVVSGTPLLDFDLALRQINTLFLRQRYS